MILFHMISQNKFYLFIFLKHFFYIYLKMLFIIIIYSILIFVGHFWKIGSRRPNKYKN